MSCFTNHRFHAMQKKQGATHHTKAPHKSRHLCNQLQCMHMTNLCDEVAPLIVLYLELAALQAGNTLEHRLDDVPLHTIEKVNPASLQVLIHLRIQQHLEILDVEWRSLYCTAVQSAMLSDNMSCVCDASMHGMTVSL